MRKHSHISLLLSLMIFFLQASGLHVHSHSAAQKDAAADHAHIHFAIATDHAGDAQSHHEEGIELSVPDSGMLKKAGFDGDELFVAVVQSHSYDCQTARHHHVLEDTSDLPLVDRTPFQLPPLRAPPLHSA